MKIDEFSWLISELRLLKNEYNYLETVNGRYDPINFCYIVIFNCNFCGEFFAIPVTVADYVLFNYDTVKEIEKAFSDYYSAYEKYFT